VPTIQISLDYETFFQFETLRRAEPSSPGVSAFYGSALKAHFAKPKKAPPAPPRPTKPVIKGLPKWERDQVLEAYQRRLDAWEAEHLTATRP